MDAPAAPDFISVIDDFYFDRRVQPKRGRLVLAPAGFTHTHRGNVPRSEDKSILASWLMFQPASRLYR